VIAGTAALIFGSILSAAQQAPASKPTPRPAVPTAQAPLDGAARALARAGRRAEYDDAMRLLAEIGAPEADLAKARAAADKEFAKPNKAPSANSEAIRLVKTAAKEVAKAFAAETDEAARQSLAATLLAIDGEAADARALLGHKKIDGEWYSPEDIKAREGRAKILEAIREIRRMEIPVETSESDNRIAKATFTGPVTCAQWKQFSLHTYWSPEKAARVVRETLRAMALSTYLRVGEVRLPHNLKLEWVHSETNALYKKTVEETFRRFNLTPKERDEALLGDVYCSPQKEFGLVHAVTEADVAALGFLYGSQLYYQQPCLAAGHYCWVCVTYLGTALQIGTRDREPAGPTPTSTRLTEDNERKEMLRLAGAGIAGPRAWLRYLAERREDPPWSRSFVDQMGKVKGDDLLKSTFVIEYLQELGPLGPLFRAAYPDAERNKNLSPPDIMARALKEPVPMFEERWHRWMVSERSLLELLEQKAEPSQPTIPNDPAARELNQIRRAAFAHELAQHNFDVATDRNLSETSRKHAEYLQLHPDQAAAWPDAHEEYPDREGYSPEGAFAGTHSVIAPGKENVKDAIDAWMATFYHRTPLLMPGLVRIGWALEHRYAILDCASMCGAAPYAMDVVWPASGATGVPLQFAPELPNPVPKEDQSNLGYPITLQCFFPDQERHGTEVAMRLFVGSEKGAEVECWYSTPEKPTNEVLAPADTYCLMPKAHLKPATKYFVIAEWQKGGKSLKWVFTTK
jgi:hypothetical protein